jgi:hypothetical protein
LLLCREEVDFREDPSILNRKSTSHIYNFLNLRCLLIKSVSEVGDSS